ncbi:glycosyltransferase family 2 protein [Roseococcus sp. YIM B11640]|uniref:glycosyltransferase family 2 protein n=1 Tax=Roseococcus sp. YIM B11640 TaxID=3133973 RepID=UPI003C7DC908
MKLSIVATLYRSAADLPEFHRRCMTAAAALTSEVEMILVDDGSPDESLAVALDLQAGDPRIVVLELARNFGHHKAMMTGLAHARGDLVFLLDSDLEEPPEILTDFHQTLTEGEWDVVHGVQRQRKGGLFERISGALFYALMDRLSDRRLPRNLLTARLMRRSYVEALVAHADRSFQISDLWALTGFRQTAQVVDKLSLSPTTYTLGRRFRMAVQQITTTSTRLLDLLFYGGLAIWGLAILVMGFFLLRYLWHGIGVDGWTSLFLSIWFFGGLIVLALGILGIYLAAVLEEVKRRPYTHLRRLHRAPSAEGPSA